MFSRLPYLCVSESHFLLSFSQVKSLVFDQSGTYLAVGGSDIRVYICKQWSEVLNFTGEKHQNLSSNVVPASIQVNGKLASSPCTSLYVFAIR